jgi:PadR family transcriptional regulator PadR
MQEPTFWILTALADEPQHGYSILSTVEDLSGNQVKLKVPTLYQALDRLQKSGLVEIDKEIVVDGRFRRYFKLTKIGRLALLKELETRKEVVRRASRHLGLAEGSI